MAALGFLALATRFNEGGDTLPFAEVGADKAAGPMSAELWTAAAGVELPRRARPGVERALPGLGDGATVSVVLTTAMDGRLTGFALLPILGGGIDSGRGSLAEGRAERECEAGKGS